MIWHKHRSFSHYTGLTIKKQEKDDSYAGLIDFLRGAYHPVRTRKEKLMLEVNNEFWLFEAPNYDDAQWLFPQMEQYMCPPKAILVRSWNHTGSKLIRCGPDFGIMLSPEKAVFSWLPKFIPADISRRPLPKLYDDLPDGYETWFFEAYVNGRPVRLSPEHRARLVKPDDKIEIRHDDKYADYRVPLVKHGDAFFPKYPLIRLRGLKKLEDAELLDFVEPVQKGR